MKQKIYALPGKYYTESLRSYGKDHYAQTAIFEKTTNFANTYDLDIKVVGKMNEGFMREGIPVIFEKRL